MDNVKGREIPQFTKKKKKPAKTVNIGAQDITKNEYILSLVVKIPPDYIFFSECINIH